MNAKCTGRAVNLFMEVHGEHGSRGCGRWYESKASSEKQLQEWDTCDVEGNNKDNRMEPYFDQMEFANQYFNHFERGGDSAIMDTLTSKSNLRDVIPKYEMKTFAKSSTVPNCHVHLCDLDNVQVACLMFRVS